MKQNKTGTILIYNCRGPKFAKLPQILAMLRIRMRRVEPGQYHLSLLELAKGEGEAVETTAEPMPENMLVFCGMHQVFLNQLLEVIRLSKMPPIELKAILTEDNKDWDSLKLREELLAEKAKIEAEAKAADEAAKE